LREVFTVPITVTFTPGSDAGASALQDWALDAVNGDLALDGGGDALYLTGVAAIASDLDSCFRTFLGEWYLDLTLGFPWFQDVLGQRYDAALFRRDSEQLALSRPGVVALQDWVSSFDNVTRNLAAIFNVKTDTGELIAGQLTATQGA
jgi:hypothetical protein